MNTLNGKLYTPLVKSVSTKKATQYNTKRKTCVFLHCPPL